jgi:hypothetical protein
MPKQRERCLAQIIGEMLFYIKNISWRIQLFASYGKENWKFLK